MFSRHTVHYSSHGGLRLESSENAASAAVLDSAALDRCLLLTDGERVALDGEGRTSV